MGLLNLFRKKKKEAVWDKTMQVLFCFQRNTFSIGDILDLMARSKTFQAGAVSRERDFEVLTTARIDQLKNAAQETSEKMIAEGVTFLDRENEHSVFIESYRNRENCQLLCWSFGSMEFLESSIFNELIAHPKFIVAYCHNTQDHLAQNTTYTRIEDIENNPGRFVISDEAFLVSAWKSWFGKNFYSLIDKEKILQFDKAFSIEQLNNEVTSVQLYNNHEDFNNAESRLVQLSFREWMGYKKLAGS